MARAVLEGAVESAREAAVEMAGDPGAVGAHLGMEEVDGSVASHRFVAELPGYRGWVWDVVLATASRSKRVGVSEVHLIPSDDALLAPAWVPWEERIRPGDLDAQMMLPYEKNDPRLVPGYEEIDVDVDSAMWWEWGLGRARVLGVTGRDAAVERWHKGTQGPLAASAQQSPEGCGTCAFAIPLAGSMRDMFAVCANEWSPSDGRVVSHDHGCGAHSETDVEPQTSRWPHDSPVVDTVAPDQVDLEAQESAASESQTESSVPEAEQEPPESPAGQAAHEKVEQSID